MPIYTNPNGKLFKTQPVSDHPLNDQLRGWWLGDLDFASAKNSTDGITPGPILDMSRYGNWLWNYNATQYTETYGFSGSKYKRAPAAYFNYLNSPTLHRDDYTNYGQNVYLTTTTTVTISLWFYFVYPNTGSVQTFVVNGRGYTSAEGGTANYCLRRIAGTNQEEKVDFYFWNTAASDWAIWRTNDQVLSPNAWNHLTLTHRFGDSSSTKLWIYYGGPSTPYQTAGSWVYGNGSGTPYSSPDGFWIGRLGRGAEQFNGYMSDIQIRHSYFRDDDYWFFIKEVQNDYPELKNRVGAKTWFLPETTSSGFNSAWSRGSNILVSPGVF